MKVHPVNSQKTMLKPQDIFAVAAYEDKEGAKACKEAAQKVGISPERMYYSLMIQEYSDPGLIRLRSGNTLFTIAAFKEGIGFVRGYNGDTAQNYIDNILEMVDAARKMGFQLLVAHTSEAATKAVQLAVKKNKRTDLAVEFDAKQELLAIAIKRGE